MKIAPVLLIPMGIVLSAAVALAPGRAEADTVVLKNGSVILGKVTDNRKTSGEVAVDVGGGKVILRDAQVERIEAGEAKESAAPREPVTVKIAKGGDYYGSDTFTGIISPESNEREIVLEVPGGKVRIPRSEKTVITKADNAAVARPAAMKEPPADRTIRTTHVVHLKNGRKLTGNVATTPESEPVKLEIPGLGSVKVQRDTIASIEEKEGAIELPPEPAPVPEAPAQPKPQLPPEVREELKKEIRAEIIRELLDRIIEEKLGDAGVEAVRQLSLEDIPTHLSNEEVLAILDSVRELGRQRNQNRVRAENHLKRMGSAVLPFLRAAASHPFDLTRRAVQRIVRDIGDPRGAPLSIEALDDEDFWVRSLARDALRKILPSSIAYDPAGPRGAWLEAQAGYRKMWEETAKEKVKDDVLEKMAYGG